LNAEFVKLIDVDIFCSILLKDEIITSIVIDII
jgi:hypothetical protein